MERKQINDDEKVNSDVFDWLAFTPPSDVNFKSNLERANVATINAVLEHVTPEGNKTRVTVLKARLRKLEKDQPSVSPEGKIIIEFADEGDVFSENRLYNLPVSLIVPSPFESQAERRKRFTPEKLEELGESIRLNGLIEPITVRERRGGETSRYFEIVCGERRWLASQLKELASINCFIRDLTDSQTLVMQYEENHQQQPNAPLDDALTFKLLHEKAGLSEQEIADRTGTTRRNVTNKLKLNDLIPEARAQLERDSLPLNHAYYLAKFPVDTQREICREKFAYKYNDSEEKAVSFDEFKAEVDENILRRLKNAPFNIGDPRLHIRQLICVECPEQTGTQNYLFPDHAGGDARCMNPSCFRIKTDTHLKLKREEIAETKPNPTAAPMAEVVKSVPLITTESYVPPRQPFAEKVLTSVRTLPEPECEFSELSLAIGGEHKGKQVYICRNDDCPVHHPKPTEPSSEEIERREKHLEAQVDKSVRLHVLETAGAWFDDYKPFWQFDDLIKDLIFSFLWITRFTHEFEFLYFFKQWTNAPKDFTNKAAVRLFVDSLGKRRQSQILFLMSQISEMPNSRQGKTDESGILHIAAGYTSLDFEETKKGFRKLHEELPE